MADSKVIGRVHGKHSDYLIKEVGSIIMGSQYYVVRDSDGQTWGSYDSRAAAYRAAHEKAGPDATEMR
ncbi:MAG: hypothetical protein Q8Q08_01055 [Candidatus Omnitrophota bacterium]|nr:hypothetical protein [Candidatus Omnitrophota bacterium]MDZ4241262.1 hypothetical protein [Candidatus Omnitrophota bacterium]